MIKLKFDKLYMNDRIGEPCTAAFPLPKGKLFDINSVAISNADTGTAYPIQCKPTSMWEDGSVKWLFMRFLADIPGNKGIEYICDFSGGKVQNQGMISDQQGKKVIDTGAIKIVLGDKGIFDSVSLGSITYSKAQFEGPVLQDGNGRAYDLELGDWTVVEDGAVCCVLKSLGTHTAPDGTKIGCEVKLTAYADKPWVELAYRIINTTYEDLHVEDLTFKFHTTITDGAYTTAAESNYATHYSHGEQGETVEKVIDSARLVYAGNEHAAEVFYGTLFADYRNSELGLCATIFQGHQNFPKAVKSHSKGLCVSLVPKGVDKVVMHSGVARQQKILLHFHDGTESMDNLNNRSTIYQMPDKPTIDPQVYSNANVLEDVFVEKKNIKVERKLAYIGDGHARCYGMLNWGDSPDPGYSSQGRGGGGSVWTNNEYDFSHQCTLQYVRTGYRRFLDYMLVSSSHWMDVDICHFSDDPLTYKGQWEHSKEHCVGSHMACSHEWVAGLLDYYHFSGDEDGLDAAMGIGNNVLRILESPEFSSYGALHARETGWALRTFVDMYNQTNDEMWLNKCDWIVGHFEQWEAKYDGWLAPYTDNTVVRVVFMIAIAIASLMRYYRLRPSDKIRAMIMRGVDDLIENCMTDTGLFFYKELPSLQRTGGTNVLEALAIGYELTGDKKYIEAGLGTLEQYMSTPEAPPDFTKRIEGDALINAGTGTKPFAQSFWPVVSYYKAATRCGLL